MSGLPQALESQEKLEKRKKSRKVSKKWGFLKNVRKSPEI